MLQLSSEYFNQLRIAVLGPKRSLPFDAFLSLHSLEQPVNSDQGGVSSIEASDISERTLFCLLDFFITRRCRTASVQKLCKRFVGRTIIHLLQNLLDVGKKTTVR